MYVEYSWSSSVSKIIIDGFSTIQERKTDFSDIDVKNIPTILITDLSEIERFETIGNYGFEFFNFTKENLKLDHSANLSPFHSFEKKLRKYISFNVVKEICQDAELEATTQKIHSIEKDETNNDLTSLKISLIQLTNLVSRVAHIPTKEEISVLNSKLNSIETLFLRCRMWLGDSHKPIEESISLLNSVISRFGTQQSEKCSRLKILLCSKQYDYIICTTEEEAKAKGYTLKVGKFPFSASGKASAAGAKEGFVKVIYDAKYGELLGAHMIGANVTEMIAEIVAARKLETTGMEILKIVHPHPTMSEGLKEATAAAYGEAIDI